MAAIRCRLLLPRGFCISKRVQEVQLGYGVNKLDYYLVEVIPTYVQEICKAVLTRAKLWL